jgi:hypothetical protein
MEEAESALSLHQYNPKTKMGQEGQACPQKSLGVEEARTGEWKLRFTGGDREAGQVIVTATMGSSPKAPDPSQEGLGRSTADRGCAKPRVAQCGLNGALLPWCSSPEPVLWSFSLVLAPPALPLNWPHLLLHPPYGPRHVPLAWGSQSSTFHTSTIALRGN